MGYYDVLAKFLSMFPQFVEKIRFWSPGGTLHTIRAEMADGQQYIFTYWNEKEWDLTALNAAVRRI